MSITADINNVRLLDATFAEETEKASQEQLFHLITFFIPENKTLNMPATEWRIVDANHDVSYQGQKYGKFPVRFGGAGISTDGTVDKTTLSVANVTRFTMDLISAYDGMRNVKVRVTSAYSFSLDDIYVLREDGSIYPNYALGETNPNMSKVPTASMDDEYIIDAYSATDTVVSFSMNPIIDLDIRLPRRRFLVDSCSYRYKDFKTCQYRGIKGYLEANKMIFRSDTSSAMPLSVIGLGAIVYSSNFAESASAIISNVIPPSDPLSTGVESKPRLTLDRVVGLAAGVEVYLDIPEFLCNKNMLSCYLRGNVHNFGGFPGINGSRRIFL